MLPLRDNGDFNDSCLEQMMQSDPFEYLQNAGNHPQTWILLLGPLALLFLLLVILGIYIRWQRQKAYQKMEADLKSLSALSSGVKQDQSTAIESTVSEQQLVESSSSEGMMSLLRRGLLRTKDAISGGLEGIFSSGAKIDDSTLERIHEVLYRSDVGVQASDRLVGKVRQTLSGQTVDWPTIRAAIAEAAKTIFIDADRPLNQPETGLYVLLIVGVNGVGKTTTIGKLASKFKSQGKSVMLCAADTYRAAAIEQLTIWGERNDVPVIKQQQGSDPAAVAYDGVQAAKSRGVDVLIIDTAGRLHNKNDLMAELSKINKSIGKGCEGGPHDTWIVVDATTGQNATQQVKAFNEVTHITGIVVTKLDGTAKGGVIIGIADQFKIPIRYVGVGEAVQDLRPFNPGDFMDGILGV
jgi:fused signal recognition particle receptor